MLGVGTSREEEKEGVGMREVKEGEAVVVVEESGVVWDGGVWSDERNARKRRRRGGVGDER